MYYYIFLEECPPLRKNHKEVLKTNDPGCVMIPDHDLPEYLFCEHSCHKQDYSCQLKDEYKYGLVAEVCDKGGETFILYY